MYYLGVDLGGTNIVVGLIDESGKIIKSITKPTIATRKSEEIFDDIINMCKEIISEFSLTKENLKGIGMGIPGEIDSKKGIINYSNNIPFKNFNAKEYVEKELDFPIAFANDADCAALGELVAGSAKGCSDIIILTLGTGVGGGIIINGKIYSGYYAGGAELGHMTIIHNGIECSCGNKGCLESYASATALIRDAKISATNNPSSALNNEDIENITAKFVFDTAEKGDTVAKELVENYIEYLAVGVANFINIFKPEMILLGGGISKQGEKLVKPLIEKTSKKLFGGSMLTKIDIATLGNDAGLIGAAMLVR
ncbi:MAG: ROK family protein [Eubacteriales bacterium]|nr:ROK family protein [Eubacteriales bacterium]